LRKRNNNADGAQEVRRSTQAQGCGFGEHTRESAQRAFFGYFLCTGKESDSLAAGE
jgi:hypothetical protein